MGAVATRSADDLEAVAYDRNEAEARADAGMIRVHEAASKREMVAGLVELLDVVSGAFEALVPREHGLMRLAAWATKQATLWRLTTADISDEFDETVTPRLHRLCVDAAEESSKMVLIALEEVIDEDYLYYLRSQRFSSEFTIAQESDEKAMKAFHGTLDEEGAELEAERDAEARALKIEISPDVRVILRYMKKMENIAVETIAAIDTALEGQPGLSKRQLEESCTAFKESFIGGCSAATALLAERRFAEAVEAFRRLIERDDQSFVAWFGEGYALYELTKDEVNDHSDFDERLLTWRSCAILEPDCYEAQEYLASLLVAWLLGQQDTADPGDLLNSPFMTEAERTLEGMLRLRPKSKDVFEVQRMVDNLKRTLRRRLSRRDNDAVAKVNYLREYLKIVRRRPTGQEMLETCAIVGIRHLKMMKPEHLAITLEMMAESRGVVPGSPEMTEIVKRLAEGVACYDGFYDEAQRMLEALGVNTDVTAVLEEMECETLDDLELLSESERRNPKP